MRFYTFVSLVDAKEWIDRWVKARQLAWHNPTN